MNALERALADCLDAIASGADAAVILARHPELADDVRPLLDLAVALDGLPALPGPSPAFRAGLAASLAAAPAPTSLAAPLLPTTEVVHALDEALARLDRGEPLDAVIAGLPLGGRELRALVPLAAALEHLPQAAGPTAAFRAALAERLAAAPAPSSLAARRPARTFAAAWLGRVWASTAATAALAATIILFAGAGVGMAARDALPGNGLYPVKLGMERVQLWLAGDANVTVVLLSHARHRLDEAILVPDRAVDSLGRFNRDVTAALGGADAALAAGAPRERVADPLVAWLGGARHDLIMAQQDIPVAAWRAARAVIDEGIVAFREGGGLAERTIPRLAPGREVLSARAAETFPWTGRIVLAPIRRPADAIVVPPTAPDAEPAPPVVQVALAGPAPGAAAPVAPAPEQPTAAPPEPTRAPDRPRPTDRPRATDPAPTAPPATPEPTEPPPTSEPTEPPIEPTQPLPSPTEPPAPTPTPGAQPAVLELHCTPDPVMSAGTADCHVTNLDGQDVQIAWSVSMGRMEPSSGDPLAARFLDVGGISGVSRLFVTVTAALVPGPAWSGGELPSGQVVIVVEPEHGVAP